MRTILLIAVLLPVAAAVGCSGGNPALAPVTGRVLFRGVPLPSGTIVFTPDPQRGGRGPQAWAEVHEGRYRLNTGTMPGAVPCWHRITIASLPPASEPGAQASDKIERLPMVRLPARYRDPELSELIREVKAGQENVIDLDLE
jgi:hypothetical protein